MQQDLGLSNSQTKILLSNFRLATGSQKVIDKNAFTLYTDPGEKSSTRHFFLIEQTGVSSRRKKRQKSIKTWNFQQ